MSDLLDIVPSTACSVVKINGGRYIVRGITISAMASIISRFPALKAIAAGGSTDDIIPKLIIGGGAAIGPIIAAACGHAGDPKYEEIANKLLPEEQLEFLQPIVELTFPNGLGPFVEKLTRLISGASEGTKVVKVRLRKPSPLTSPTSSGEDSHPTLQ